MRVGARTLVVTVIMASGLFSLTVAYEAAGREPAGGAATGILDSAPVKLDRLDPAIDQIVPKGAVLERIANGFTWVEGPVWLDNALFFAEK